MPEAPHAEPALATVSVRALCAFAAKQGDLDLRFTPAPSAQEGIAGHRLVARRRGPGWQAEFALEARHGTLRVRGRADGVDLAGARLDEVKTHRGPAARIPAHHRALHRAQARVYGWMLAAQHALPAVDVGVVYLDIDAGTETREAEQLDAAALHAFFADLAGRYLAWAEREAAHRAARDAWLATLAWPFAEFRAGQRELATAVYNAARSGRHLLAQAPTGIGKTMATVFPMLKALPTQGLDKLFYLTAKTPGRQLALDAVARLGGDAPAPLRVVALVARDKACEHPDKACHGDSCPLARGFYDRLGAARTEAVQRIAAPADAAAVRGVALAHGICPYYLTQELVRWADVVVADYNYLFDTSALLQGLTVENDWKTALLVDEAHNLAARAREMYSATLAIDAMRAAKAEAPKPLQPKIERVRRAAAAIAKAQAAEGIAYRSADAVPGDLSEALRKLVAAAGALMVDDPTALRGAALQLHFDALLFLALADALDRHSQFDVTLPATAAPRGKVDATLCLRNVVPAPFLQPRFAQVHAAVLFSATLAPPQHHRRMLGLPDDCAEVDIASPFDAAQLDVQLVPDVPTRFRQRDASRTRLAGLIAAQFRARPGNYLAFFSSFDYLDQVAAAVAAQAPELPLRLQQRRMGEAERQAFVDSFAEGGAQIGFAVLGGAFGEGIDLPGSRLVGAFVATLGLPQLNPVNEAMKARLATLFGGDGWDHAYLYPGLQKVVQAAGRVIRTPADRGVLLLIDDRFARPEVRALLPAWWAPRLRRAGG
jgi:DNA excision repair protein ERCC-2